MQASWIFSSGPLPLPDSMYFLKYSFMFSSSGSSSLSSMVGSVITASYGTSAGLLASAAGGSCEVPGMGSVSVTLAVCYFSAFNSCFRAGSTGSLPIT